MTTKGIKVVLGANIKRTSVVIDPKMSASDNPQTGAQAKNILASGASTQEVLKKLYGRR